MMNINTEVNYAIQRLESIKNDSNKGDIDTAVALIDSLYNRYAIMVTAYSQAMEKLKNATAPETEIDDYWSGPGDNRRDNYDEFEIDE